MKTSDEGIEKEYDLPSLPALVFYRNKFRQIYTGKFIVMGNERQFTFYVQNVYFLSSLCLSARSKFNNITEKEWVLMRFGMP